MQRRCRPTSRWRAAFGSEITRAALPPVIDGHIPMLTGAAVQREFARAGTVALGRIGAASHASGGAIKLHILGSAGADHRRVAAGRRHLIPRSAAATSPRWAHSKISWISPRRAYNAA